MVWLIGVVVVVAALVYWHISLAAIGVATLAWIMLTFGEAFVVGAPLFWILILCESGLLFWALDERPRARYDVDADGAIATVAILLGLLILQLFGNIRVFSYVWAHPWWSLAFVAGYLAIGGVWSIAKWWFAETNKFRRVKDRFLLDHHVQGTRVPAELHQEWAAIVKAYKTNPANEKSRTLFWISYWPWSLVWTLLNDPLKRAARRIYDELGMVYQRITDYVWQVEPPVTPLDTNDRTE
jgi:hypothetical protein